MVDGWWRSPDVGRLDGDGYLTLSGRADDCLRTGAGHLVNPADVAAALEGYPGVTDVAVVPIEAAAGSVLGVLVQNQEPLSLYDLRGHLMRRLPPWSQPRVLEAVPELPRLPSGRIDRRACIALLEKTVRSS
jgi:acyl-coenzyme A synthetase/AMP-(fatty) acid ligase